MNRFTYTRMFLAGRVRAVADLELHVPLSFHDRRSL